MGSHDRDGDASESSFAVFFRLLSCLKSSPDGANPLEFPKLVLPTQFQQGAKTPLSKVALVSRNLQTTNEIEDFLRQFEQVEVEIQ